MTKQSIYQHWNNGLLSMEEVHAYAKQAGLNARFIHNGTGKGHKLVLYTE